VAATCTGAEWKTAHAVGDVDAVAVGDDRHAVEDDDRLRFGNVVGTSRLLGVVGNRGGRDLPVGGRGSHHDQQVVRHGVGTQHPDLASLPAGTRWGHGPTLSSICGYLSDPPAMRSRLPPSSGQLPPRERCRALIKNRRVT
jgi:hypothetical protein